jgi:hypothetical protein
MMRYAHLSPGYLSDEIHKLDGFRLRPSTAAPAATAAPPSPAPEPPSEKAQRPKGKKRAKSATQRRESSEIRDFVRKSGSPPWTLFDNGSFMQLECSSSPYLVER